MQSMRSAMTRLLVATAVALCAAGVSLWWFSARVTDPARVERVAVAALSDPAVRDFVTNQIVAEVASASGLETGAVRDTIAGLDPEVLAQAVIARVKGVGIDVTGLAKELAAGNLSKPGAQLPTSPTSGGLRLDVPVLGAASAVSRFATWAAFGSVVAAGAAVTITRRRGRTLRVVGRAWMLAGGSIVAVTVLLPKLIERQKGVGWSLARAWLDGGVDLSLPIAAVVAGGCCVAASILASLTK